MLWHICGGQGTILSSLFSPSTLLRQGLHTPSHCRRLGSHACPLPPFHVGTRVEDRSSGFDGKHFYLLIHLPDPKWLLKHHFL